MKFVNNNMIVRTSCLTRIRVYLLYLNPRDWLLRLVPRDADQDSSRYIKSAGLAISKLKLELEVMKFTDFQHIGMFLEGFLFGKTPDIFYTTLTAY